MVVLPMCSTARITFTLRAALNEDELRVDAVAQPSTTQAVSCRAARSMVGASVHQKCLPHARGLSRTTACKAERQWQLRPGRRAFAKEVPNSWEFNAER